MFLFSNFPINTYYFITLVFKRLNIIKFYPNEDLILLFNFQVLTFLSILFFLASTTFLFIIIVVKYRVVIIVICSYLLHTLLHITSL
jgi:hypothetical protein